MATTRDTLQTAGYFAVIEGYCGIAEVTPGLPVLRSQLLPVVRGVPRWSCV